jgi:hypothetical protein
MIVEKYVPPANPAFLRHCEHGVPLGERDTDCGEPAVVDLIWDSAGDRGSQTLCVRHAFWLTRELQAVLWNVLTPVDTEEG